MSDPVLDIGGRAVNKTDKIILSSESFLLGWKDKRVKY